MKPQQRTTPTSTAMALMRQRWQALDTRERRGLTLAGSIVALALLWWLACAPVLQTWRHAPAEHQRLDTDLARMQTLQAEARQLQSATTLSASQARSQLETSLTQQLGQSAKLTVTGVRATVTLTQASAAATQRWLAQVRANAHAIPVELRLARSNTSATDAAATWGGSIVLQLPAN